MFKSFLAFILLTLTLSANNQIKITATVATHATVQEKITHTDRYTMKQDIYLKNNYGGLTIALTDSSYGSSTLMNYIPLSINPINFSDDIHTKPTKVAELIISQKENRGSLGITVSVK